MFRRRSSPPVATAAIPSGGAEFDALMRRWLQWKPLTIPLTGPWRWVLLVALPIVGVSGGIAAIAVSLRSTSTGSEIALLASGAVVIVSTLAMLAGIPSRLLPLVNAVFAVLFELVFWFGLAIATFSEILLGLLVWQSFHTGWSRSRTTITVVVLGVFTLVGFVIASGTAPPLVTKRWRVRLASATASVIPWVILLLTAAVTVVAVVAEETAGHGNDLVTGAVVAAGAASFGLAPALHRARARRAVIFERAFADLIKATTAPLGDDPLHDPPALRAALLQLESLLLTRRWPPRRPEVPEAAGEVMIYLVVRLLWPDATWRRPWSKAPFDKWLAGSTETELVGMLRHGCIEARLGVLGQRVSRNPFGAR